MFTNDYKSIEVLYTNWRGETRSREIIPKSARFGATQYNPDPQQLVVATDVETKRDKEFALSGFHKNIMLDYLKPKDKVILNTPDNSRLDRCEAEVLEVTDWGAIVRCGAASSGQFRASYSEMVKLDSVETAQHRSKATLSGYTGDICTICGSARMRRNGTCLLCESCGTTTGC